MNLSLIHIFTLGASGAFAGMGKGKIFVDHTTASAEIARELYAAGKKDGFDCIDATVSGLSLIHIFSIVEPGILLTQIEAERKCAEQRPGRVLADVVIHRRVAHLDGAVLHRVERLQWRHDLAAGESLNLEFSVRRLRDVFGDGRARAEQRIERLQMCIRDSRYTDRSRGRYSGRRRRFWLQ